MVCLISTLEAQRHTQKRCTSPPAVKAPSGIVHCFLVQMIFYDHENNPSVPPLLEEGIKFPNLCPNQRLHASKWLDQHRYPQSANARAEGREKKCFALALHSKLILTPVFLLPAHLFSEFVVALCFSLSGCVCVFDGQL